MTGRLGTKGTVKRVVVRATRTATAARVIQVLDRLDRGREPVIPILMYHRVDSAEGTPELDPALVSATPAEFARQIEYLAANRRALSLSELLDVRSGRMPLPHRAVMVTFDDAYRDFKEHAWPALKQHGVPATLFVPTAYPDDPSRAFWWDRLYAAFTTTDRRDELATPAGTLRLGSAAERERGARILAQWVLDTSHNTALSELGRVESELGGRAPGNHVLSWQELRELAADGLDLGPHTRTHPPLHQIPLEQAQEEILGSVADLEREIGGSFKALAFPNGGFTSELVEWLPEAGVEMAFTVRRGVNDLADMDWLQLRRINVGRRSALPAVRAQMLSWPTTLRRRLGALGLEGSQLALAAVASPGW